MRPEGAKFAALLWSVLAITALALMLLVARVTRNNTNAILDPSKLEQARAGVTEDPGESAVDAQISSRQTAIDRDTPAIHFSIEYTTNIETPKEGELTIYSSQESDTDVDRRTMSSKALKVLTRTILPNQPLPLTDLPIGNYIFSAIVPGHYLDECWIRIVPSMSMIHRPLLEANGIICTVVNSEGSPVPYAEVRMLPSNKMGIVETHSEVASIQPQVPIILETNELGTVVFTSPSSQLSRLHVIPPDPYAELILWDVRPGEIVQAVVNQGASILGQVVNERKEPIQDCNIAIYTQDQYGAEVPIAATRTDDGGWYRLERIDVRTGAWHVFAEKANWEMKRTVIRNPQGGEAYSMDFQLRSAIPGAFRLITPSGSPLSGVGVHFMGVSGSEVPFTWITDARGRFLTGSHLVLPLEYEVQCVVGGIVANIGSLRQLERLEPTRDHEIVVGNMGLLHLAKMSRAASISEIEVELADTLPPMIKRWEPPFGPLWLPEGEYHLTAFSSGALVAQLSHRVVAQRSQEIEFLVGSSLLEFDTGKEKDLYVAILSQTNIVIWENPEARGRTTVSLPVGQYYFSCSSSRDGSWDTPIFTLSESGLNYGILSANTVCSGAFTGTVSTVDGAPIPAAAITATSRDGYRTVKSVTGPDGRYELRGLALGDYDLTCDLYGQTGIHTPLYRQKGRIAADDDVSVLNFSCDLQRTVVVALPSWAASAALGFAICPTGSQFEPIDAAARYRIYAPDSEIVVGACLSSKRGAMEVMAVKVHAGASLIDVSDLAASRQQVTIAQQGTPEQMGFTVELELQGLQIGGPVFDKDGRFELAVTSTEDLDLVIVNRQGLLRRIPLGESSLITLDETTPREKASVMVTAENSDGSIHLSVFLDCCNLRMLIAEGSPITTRCSREWHGIIVDAPGYVGLRQDVAAGDRLHLRRAVALKFVDLSNAAPNAHTLLVSDGVTGASIARLRPTPEGIVRLPELPSGNYRFVAFDTANLPVWDLPTYLAVEGPSSMVF